MAFIQKRKKEQLKEELNELEKKLINIERLIGGMIMDRYNRNAIIDREKKILEYYDIRISKINEINEKRKELNDICMPSIYYKEAYLMQQVIGIMGAEGIVDDSIMKFMYDFSLQLEKKK